ncbi:MAG: hypothetical protein Salg2KO_09710 [Salibacteraceae bacterium]
MVALDALFEEASKEKPQLSQMFAESGMVSSIIYDTNGLPQHVHQTPDQFEAQISAIQRDFDMDQTPLVLVYREYETVASIFCSALIQFKDRTTGEEFEATNMQSIKLVLDEDGWKVNQISIQNEHPSFPIDSIMKPTALKEKHRADVTLDPPLPPRPLDDFSTEYDPDKVYNVNEVDEPPTYPSGEQDFKKLCERFGVVTEPIPAYTPFMVTIAEDGEASLSYAHDLSGFQIAQAESFVRSMLIWYPAIKYAASVKCKLLFYIRA